MSFDLNIYTKDTSEELIQKMVNRFSHFGMNVEFHPDFKFDPDEDSGFVPFKLSLKVEYLSTMTILENQ